MTPLECNISAAAVILAAAVLRAACFKRLPKRCFKALWAVAVLRLLLPFSLVIEIPVEMPVQAPPAAHYQTYTQDIPAYELATEAFQPPAAQRQPSSSKNSKLLPILYYSAAALIFGGFVLAHLKNKRAFRGSLPCEDKEILKFVQGAGLRREIRLRISDRILTPVTYGLLRPVIVLPKTLEKSEEKHILLHELTHIRSFDVLYKLLLAAAVCLNWLNLFAWVMLVLANRDIEHACDETVLRAYPEERADYARTLLRLEEQKNNILLSAFSRNAVAERIEAIMKFKKKGIAATIAAAALVTAGALTVFVSAAEVPAKPAETDKDGKFTPDESTTSFTAASGVQFTVTSESGVQFTPDENVPSFTGATTLPPEYVPQEAGSSTMVELPEDLPLTDENGNAIYYEIDESGNYRMLLEEERQKLLEERQKLLEEIEENEDYRRQVEEERQKLLEEIEENEKCRSQIEEIRQGLLDMKGLIEIFGSSAVMPVSGTWSSSHDSDGNLFFVISAEEGAEIRAVGNGMVTFAGCAMGYGNTVAIEDEYSYVTIYAHCGDIGDLDVLDSVQAGDVIGHVGTSGAAEKPELFLQKGQALEVYPASGTELARLKLSNDPHGYRGTVVADENGKLPEINKPDDAESGYVTGEDAIGLLREKFGEDAAVPVEERFADKARYVGADSWRLPGSDPHFEFPADSGSDAYAVIGGTVTEVSEEYTSDGIPSKWKWGKYVIIRGEDENTVFYSHLSEVGVSAGDTVKAGDKIGAVGQTGFCTGPVLAVRENPDNGEFLYFQF